ncbi:hypothetical protein H9Q70_000068 [Fusarium xylarioides]|nr:hypothetical protein H9Q70_000068 [Fusarium xylarioides]
MTLLTPSVLRFLFSSTAKTVCWFPIIQALLFLSMSGSSTTTISINTSDNDIAIPPPAAPSPASVKQLAMRSMQATDAAHVTVELYCRQLTDTINLQGDDPVAVHGDCVHRRLGRVFIVCQQGSTSTVDSHHDDTIAVRMMEYLYHDTYVPPGRAFTQRCSREPLRHRQQ